MAKLVDALALGASGAICGSSNLPPGTKYFLQFLIDIFTVIFKLPFSNYQLLTIIKTTNNRTSHDREKFGSKLNVSNCQSYLFQIFPHIHPFLI